MTINSARKLLGQLSVPLSDEELQEEIDFTEFLAELILKAYNKRVEEKEKLN